MVTGIVVTAMDPSDVTGATTQDYRMTPAGDPQMEFIEDLDPEWIITKVKKDLSFEATITPQPAVAGNPDPIWSGFEFSSRNT